MIKALSKFPIIKGNNFLAIPAILVIDYGGDFQTTANSLSVSSSDVECDSNISIKLIVCGHVSVGIIAGIGSKQGLCSCSCWTFKPPTESETNPTIIGAGVWAADKDSVALSSGHSVTLLILEWALSIAESRTANDGFMTNLPQSGKDGNSIW